MYQATLKVAGGKLLRVKMEIQNGNGVIRSVGLTGDFFLHPEDVLPDVEKALAGLPWPADQGVYIGAVQAVLDARGAAFVGVSAQDIAQAMLMATSSTSVGA